MSLNSTPCVPALRKRAPPPVFVNCALKNIPPPLAVVRVKDLALVIIPTLLIVMFPVSAPVFGEPAVVTKTSLLVSALLRVVQLRVEETPPTSGENVGGGVTFKSAALEIVIFVGSSKSVPVFPLTAKVLTSPWKSK